MMVELWPAEGQRQWRLVTDSVMGGMSRGTLTEELKGDRLVARMRGIVSTENNGGFVQIAMDLDQEDGFLDARAYQGVSIDVCGNGEGYGVHLRTTALTRPQQSYRQGFFASAEWQPICLPFAQFEPHRVDAPLDIAQLRRIGLVAIGRAFVADLAVARLGFY
jgi:hypothetical protein